VAIGPWTCISLDLISYRTISGQMTTELVAKYKHLCFVLRSQFKLSNVSFDIFATQYKRQKLYTATLRLKTTSRWPRVAEASHQRDELGLCNPTKGCHQMIVPLMPTTSPHIRLLSSRPGNN